MCSVSYASCLNVSTFPSSRSTNHVASVSQKGVLGSCQYDKGSHKFSKIFILARKLKLYHWWQYWSNRFTSFNFQESVCQILKSVTMACLLFFQAKWYFIKKVVPSAHPSDTCTSVCRRASCVLVPSWLRTVQGHSLKGWNLVKLVI